MESWLKSLSLKVGRLRIGSGYSGRRRWGEVLIVLSGLLIVVDVARAYLLPQNYQIAFTDLFEAVVVLLGAITCTFAAVRSSNLTRAIWTLVALYLALNAITDVHDFLVNVHFTGATLLTVLGFSGWCVYLPLALLIFFPEAEDHQLKWKWLPAIDFAQVTLAIGMAYFRFIYLLHAHLAQPWTHFGMPELVRNLLISLGLLLRGTVESSKRAGSIYRLIGAAFATITLFKGLFPGYSAIVSVVSRPVAFLAIGIFSAYWNERPEKADAGGTRTSALRTALSLLSAVTLLIILVLGYTTPVRYRSVVHLVMAISITLFVLRTGFADYLQRRTQEALQKSEEKFNKAFLSSPAVTAITDPMAKGLILEVNEAFERVLGYSGDQAVGQTTVELGLWVDPRQQHGLLQEALKKGGIRNREVRFRKKNGEIATGLLSVEVIQLDGKTRLLAAFIDITDRKQLEQQLAQAQKMEVVGQLAVAHEFNNLLAIILGNVDIADEKLEPDHPLSKHLGSIRKAAGRAAELTRQLLAFSRKQVMQPVILNLNHTVAEAVKMLKRLIPENIEVELRLAEDLAHVQVDPMQVDQVLMNLVLNARDAMPQGGRLCISTTNVELDRDVSMFVDPVVPSRYVMMSVSDSGVGMDEDTRSHIFEPFFTTKSLGKGTGLGLSIIEGIVKQSGGYVWVYSRPGIGTTFKIFLPCAKGDLATHAVPGERRAPTAEGSETILLVEDEPDLTLMVRTALAASGYHILSASSGEEALKLVGSGVKIDLLLTDVILKSAMDGTVLAENLRIAIPELPVIFMSGYNDVMLRAERNQVREAILLEKPFPVSALRKAVREMLNRDVLHTRKACAADL